jgi:hypothetical protein
MQTLDTRQTDGHLIDYTTVPAGLLIKGHLTTGQAVFSTVTCPKCRRVGLGTSQENGGQIIVHSGRAVGDVLLGVDYCKLEFNVPSAKSKKANGKENT